MHSLLSSCSQNSVHGILPLDVSMSTQVHSVPEGALCGSETLDTVGAPNHFLASLQNLLKRRH